MQLARKLAPWATSFAGWLTLFTADRNDVLRELEAMSPLLGFGLQMAILWVACLASLWVVYRIWQRVPRPLTNRGRLKAMANPIANVRKDVAAFLLPDPRVMVLGHQAQDTRANALELSEMLRREFDIHLPPVDANPRRFHDCLMELVPIARHGDLDTARALWRRSP